MFVRITISKSNPFVFLSGYVASIKTIPSETVHGMPRGPLYQLILKPPSLFFHRASQYRVFHHSSITASLAMLLKKYPLFHYKIAPELKTLQHDNPYIFQFDECDNAFLFRLLNELPAFAYFSQEQRTHCLRVIQPNRFYMHKNDECIKLSEDEVLSLHKYLSNFATKQQAPQTRLTVQSHRHGLKLGQRISIPGHSEPFFITHIQHQCRQCIASESSTNKHANTAHYSNKIIAYSNLEALLAETQKIKAAYPKALGVYPAKIMGSDAIPVSDFAHTVRVQLLHAPHCEIPCLVTAVRNSKQGRWYFKPAVGDNVLVQFIDGNPEKAMLLAYIDQKPPRLQGDACPLLSIKQAKNTITLRKNAKKPGILLKSEQNIHSSSQRKLMFSTEASTRAEKQRLSCQKNIRIKANYYHVTAETIHIHVGNSSIQIFPNKITIKAKNIQFITQNNGKRITTSAHDIAALGDGQRCPASTGTQAHIGGPIIQAANNFFVNGKAVARDGDTALCQGASTKLHCEKSGIYVNKKPIARHGDRTSHRGKITG